MFGTPIMYFSRSCKNGREIYKKKTRKTYLYGHMGTNSYRRLEAVLWIRNYFFFSDPDPTLTLISDPDPDSDPACL